MDKEIAPLQHPPPGIYTIYRCFAQEAVRRSCTGAAFGLFLGIFFRPLIRTGKAFPLVGAGFGAGYTAHQANVYFREPSKERLPNLNSCPFSCWNKFLR